MASAPTIRAGVAKLVYAPDSKSGEVTLMRVRVSPPAPHFGFLIQTVFDFASSLLSCACGDASNSTGSGPTKLRCRFASSPIDSAVEMGWRQALAAATSRAHLEEKRASSLRRAFLRRIGDSAWIATRECVVERCQSTPD